MSFDLVPNRRVKGNQPNFVLTHHSQSAISGLRLSLINGRSSPCSAILPNCSRASQWLGGTRPHNKLPFKHFHFDAVNNTTLLQNALGIRMPFELPIRTKSCVHIILLYVHCIHVQSNSQLPPGVRMRLRTTHQLITIIRTILPGVPPG